MTTAHELPKHKQTTVEQQQQKKTQLLHTLVAVLVQVTTGTTITSLNKWIFAVCNFPFPLLLSALHMLTAIIIDYILIRMGFINLKLKEATGLPTAAKFKVFLLSLTFCATIAFGNMGLNYVQLSFAQMISTTTPLFTIAISKVFLGQQHHILKYTAMMPICLGASFSLMGEMEFHHKGCFYIFAATLLRGVKSIQQSILLQEEKINSVILLYMMSIPSFCILTLAALLLESNVIWEPLVLYDHRLWILILLSCLGSVVYNLASFCVTTLTSAVTLHVLGNLNLVGNIIVSQILFGSEITGLSYAGIGLTLLGVLMYQNSDLIEDYLAPKAKHCEERAKFKTD